MNAPEYYGLAQDCSNSIAIALELLQSYAKPALGRILKLISWWLCFRYVKDKRPTISPNFNFLGQLLEFEKQRAEGQDEPMSASEGAQRKRQCMVELRSPTSPTVATPRFSFRPPVDSAVQSPTTALAKLNFNQPSSSEKAVTPEAELPFPHIPTTSLDSLSFTPCFAKEDSPHSPLPHGLKSSGAIKRPLSVSLADSKPRERSQSMFVESCTVVPSVASLQTAVTMRSPETKAKRPLVRPNSIAFSSYPMFDIPSESPEASPVTASPAASTPPVRPKGLALTPSSSLQPQAATPASCQEQPSKNMQRPVQMRNKPSSAGAAGRPSHFEAGRKSRSLEDILKMVEDPNDCPCVPAHSMHRPVLAAELFPPPEVLSCRCRGEPHQSSSSISSSGSHNSLHGSLEVIQVSWRGLCVLAQMVCSAPTATVNGAWGRRGWGTCCQMDVISMCWCKIDITLVCYMSSVTTCQMIE